MTDALWSRKIGLINSVGSSHVHTDRKEQEKSKEKTARDRVWEPRHGIDPSNDSTIFRPSGNHYSIEAASMNDGKITYYIYSDTHLFLYVVGSGS